MSKAASPEVWRGRVIEAMGSGMTAKDWAARRQVPYQRLTYHIRALYESEPELFVLTEKLCPCPLMAKLLAYVDPQVREYLKCVYFEAASTQDTLADGVGRLTGRRLSVFGCIRDQLDPSATPDDVSIGFLSSVSEAAHPVCAMPALRTAVFAAVSSGVHDGGPFFKWASENEVPLRETKEVASLLSRVMEGGRYLRTRLVRCRKGRGRLTSSTVVELDASTPFCTSILDGFIAAQGGTFLFYETAFLERFETSLGFSPVRLGDFSPETFGRQLRWFRENLPANAAEGPLRMTRVFYMHLIGLLPPDQLAFTFETGLPPKALGVNHIVSAWLKGYRAVVYEPLDPVPGFAKWLLYPNKNEALKASFSPDLPSLVDCSVDDPRLERLLVGWLWKGGLGATSVRVAPIWAKVLLNKVIEAGVSVARPGGHAVVVAARCVHAALAVLSETNGEKSMTSIKGKLRSLLQFGEEAGALSVEPACYLLLESVNSGSTGSSREIGAASEGNLVALARELERCSDNSIDDELAYIMFITQALTEIRPSEVLSLRMSDLDASHRKDFEAVRVCRKSGGYGYEVIEVPREVHRLLHAAAEITQPARARADGEIDQYVFLVEGHMGTTRVLSLAGCYRRYAAACSRLGIPPITPANVRKTYQTTVIMEGAKRHWDRMLLRPITGHADIGSDDCYIRPDIMSPDTRRYLEGAFVVEIGNPKIRGAVLPDEELPDEVAEIVEGGAGICRSDVCNIAGVLPCLECSGFATSPRFIPEMVEAISALDRRLASAPLHERGHLAKAKKRYLAYLGMMIDLWKGEGR